MILTSVKEGTVSSGVGMTESGLHFSIFVLFAFHISYGCVLQIFDVLLLLDIDGLQHIGTGWRMKCLIITPKHKQTMKRSNFGEPNFLLSV